LSVTKVVRMSVATQTTVASSLSVHVPDIISDEH
jgi:hypothetical protein